MTEELKNLYATKGELVTRMELIQLEMQKINQQILQHEGLIKTEKKEKNK